MRLYDDSYADPFSYIALSKILRAHARDREHDATQLFRRIVFNVYIGNMDDLGRNNGCLYDPANPGWQLSAAFDIVPAVSNCREHALGIGQFARQRSLQNVMSAAEGFGLSEDEARGIVDEVVGVAQDWRLIFEGSDVEIADIRKAEQIIGVC